MYFFTLLGLNNFLLFFEIVYMAVYDRPLHLRKMLIYSFV